LKLSLDWLKSFYKQSAKGEKNGSKKDDLIIRIHLIFFKVKEKNGPIPKSEWMHVFVTEVFVWSREFGLILFPKPRSRILSVDRRSLASWNIIGIIRFPVKVKMNTPTPPLSLTFP